MLDELLMNRMIKIAMAVAMIAVFFGLSETDSGIKIGFFPSWTNSTTGELYVWLAIPFLIFPACFLAADAISDILLNLQSRLIKLVEVLGQRSRTLAAGAFLGLFGLMVLGNHFIFHGFPFTDDEWGAMYGGQLMALGKLTEPKPSYFNALPSLFLYVKDGMMTSFDWFGALVPWAISEFFGLGNLVHLAFSAATIVAVAVLVSRRLGRGWGIFAGVLFVASPMALSLSLSTHAHVVSRAFLAFTLVAIDQILRRPSDWRPYAAAGILGGMGWTVRPVETTMLLAPLALWLIWRGIRDASTRKGLGAFLIGGLILVGLFTAHSWAVTGTLLPARLAPGDAAAWTNHHKPPFAFLKSAAILKNRLGENISYNFFLLTIWVMGPLGVFLAWWGAKKDKFSTLLLVGVVCDLAMGILHEDYGIHVVGPIHYSETTVPLIVLIAQGLKGLSDYGIEHKIDQRKWLAFVTALVVSNMFFAGVHLNAVEHSARMHDKLYSFFDDPKFDRSVVLAREYGTHWKAFPAFRNTGSFVFQWRRVKPDDERVHIFHYTKNEPKTLKALRDAMPDRKFYELRTLPRDPYIEAVDLK
jgi:hypothetical protein